MIFINEFTINVVNCNTHSLRTPKAHHSSTSLSTAHFTRNKRTRISKYACFSQFTATINTQGKKNYNPKINTSHNFFRWIIWHYVISLRVLTFFFCAFLSLSIECFIIWFFVFLLQKDCYHSYHHKVLLINVITLLKSNIDNEYCSTMKKKKKKQIEKEHEVTVVHIFNSENVSIFVQQNTIIRLFVKLFNCLRCLITNL